MRCAGNLSQYRDHEGVEHEPRLVARIVPPCRLDNKPLSELVALLCEFYGKCTVVVETNAGYALINLLSELRYLSFA